MEYFRQVLDHRQLITRNGFNDIIQHPTSVESAASPGLLGVTAASQQHGMLHAGPWETTLENQQSLARPQMTMALSDNDDAWRDCAGAGTGGKWAAHVAELAQSVQEAGPD